MDSVSNQQSPPPLFCPRANFKNKEDEFRSVNFGELPTNLPSSSHLHPLHLYKSKNLFYSEIFRELPTLFDAKYDTSFLPSSLHLRSVHRYSYDYEDKCTICYSQKVGTQLYFCKICCSEGISSIFHKECIEISKHPYHPKHSLRLVASIAWSISKRYCLCCSKKLFWLYNCSICDFTMCPDCAKKPPLFTIDHPKRHDHTLFYFPKEGSLICDVCALSDHRSLMFSCRQCDFVVHKECAYFPCIIRISRHAHRLSFISSLTPEKWLCGMCHGKIDTNYGRYACVKGCSYGVHSKCATREDVWDGKELEGIPEDAYEDIKPFNEISDGIIQHFSHQNHHMRLDVETSREFDENKRCQACTLPICDDIIYNCMQCDFILHKKCAHLPRKKYHGTHPHPLTLQVVHQDGFSTCTACELETNGFVYLCYQRHCNFKLDVCCASIAEPLDHRCHPHPLFLTYSLEGEYPLFLTFGLEGEYRCSICHNSLRRCLRCGECGFVLCFRCAALPSKLRYKHDKHFLIFSYDEDANGQYLCEVCEKEATPKNGIYMCNDCNVIVHIECLLGEDIHLMPGVIAISSYRKNINILLNNHLTRKICRKCHERCKGTIIFKERDDVLFCSYHCLHYF